MSHPTSTVPPDADIFFVGGGGPGARTHMYPDPPSKPIRHLRHTNLEGATYCAAHPAEPRSRELCVVRRNLGWGSPSFISSLAYVMTLRGAESMRGSPVRTAADFAISAKELLCSSWRPGEMEAAPPPGAAATSNRSLERPSCHLYQQYAVPRWIVASRAIPGEVKGCHTHDTQGC